MRSIEDKGCYNNGTANAVSPNNGISFEFHKGGNGANKRGSSHHRTALGKPTPSKWDDAQKWLVGLSRGGGDKNQSNYTKPRNSNADDLRLIASVPQKEQDYSISDDEQNGSSNAAMMTSQSEIETKNVDCDESVWRINKPIDNSTATKTTVVRSIYVRDMGTEMTPIASQEPSRTATPIRATTPAIRSPTSSGSSTPVRCQNGMEPTEFHQTGFTSSDGRPNGVARQCGEEQNLNKMGENQISNQAQKMNSLETRAMAWDEAERAKYMARYKREEVKIQAWENHEKRKVEMELKKMEVKAERMKARAQERLTNKLAATRRIAEEKRANAEAKLNEQAVRTSERADYIRRTGHLPSSFSFKLPSLCW